MKAISGSIRLHMPPELNAYLDAHPEAMDHIRTILDLMTALMKSDLEMQFLVATVVYKCIKSLTQEVLTRLDSDMPLDDSQYKR